VSALTGANNQELQAATPAIPKLVITNVDDFVGAEMAKKDRRNKRKRN
jgi:hypothetical protein